MRPALGGRGLGRGHQSDQQHGGHFGSAEVIGPGGWRQGGKGKGERGGGGWSEKSGAMRFELFTKVISARGLGCVCVWGGGGGVDQLVDLLFSKRGWGGISVGRLIYLPK